MQPSELADPSPQGTAMNGRRSARAAPDGQFGGRLVLAACWILALAAYNPPQRSGALTLAGLDWIALLKVASRASACGLLALALLRTPDRGRRLLVFKSLLPWALFASWAVATTLWSPFKAFTLGHSLELLILLLLAAAVAYHAREESFLSSLALNLVLIVLVVASASLILFLLDPTGGIETQIQRPFNLGHPNDIAASSGLCLLMLLLVNLLWKWRWPAFLNLPVAIVCGTFLLVAQSRTVLFAFSTCLLVVFITFRRRPGMLLGLVATVLMGVLILSAGLGDRLIEETRTYVLRGQERGDFLAASGRVELWREALGNFWQAPFQGFGYFVLTPVGYTEYAGVDKPTYGAHNLLLHVLTGTGLIGLTLFLWSVGRLILPHFLFGSLSGEERKISTLVAVIMLLFFMLGLFEVSFLSAVCPSVVVFFAILGIGVANRLELRAP